MVGTKGYQTKWNKSGRESQASYNTSCKLNLKKNNSNEQRTHKRETDSQILKTNYSYHW